MTDTVLIVANDPAESQRLAETISRIGLVPQTVAKPASVLAGAGGAPPGLVILDLDLPEMGGLALLEQMRDTLGVPIIVLTSEDGVEAAHAALAAGAADFILKPATPERVEASVRNALKISALEGELARVRRKLDGRPAFDDIVAVSAEMVRAVTLGRRAADLELPILIEGEPGTGKELIARAIHAASARADGPFAVLRCAGNAKRLEASVEAEEVDQLDRAWEEAKGGVLFIEEISELPLAAQEVLAERFTLPAKGEDGSNEVRLIGSSSKNLIDRVKKGQFREDLYYRINVFPIWLPPLRDRGEDIGPLAKHFLAQVVAEVGKRIDEIDETALVLMRAYVWPGNVRQLENAIFRGVVLADSDHLTTQEFPQIAAQVPGFRPEIPAAPVMPSMLRYEGPAMIGGLSSGTRAITLAPLTNGTTVGIPALTEEGEIRRLEDIEADLIRLALGHYRGHITEVARRLGIGRSTLYRKMREFGLEVRHN
ncbi:MULTISPECIES: sigma-54 dependent transcriptional regulator [Rhodomicrobium]|uniref:sigma-54-dependent transcriptional regulator n=1 Tax=Rhodomicrobium TaxID=1068 RepID=UPI000B4A695D|nr:MULTISPECIES: sigma-54 dependent transcriptional regulator [Rhodomicrobium]